MENILINIDSRFRDKKKYPNPGYFIYNLPTTLRNINYIRLSSIELPTTFYTFTEEYGNTSFIIETEANIYEVRIKSGNYAADFMINYIQGQLNIINNADSTNFSVSWDNIDYKVTFSNVTPFTLKFGNTGSNTPLGYYLGFRNDDTSYDMSFQNTYDDNGTTLYFWTSETFLDTTKEEYAFVRVNDYGNIFNDIRNTNLLAKIVLFEAQFVFDNGSNYLTKEYKFKNPTNITKLEIELLLPTGKTINMNSIDYSLTLEIGQSEGGAPSNSNTNSNNSLQPNINNLNNNGFNPNNNGFNSNNNGFNSNNNGFNPNNRCNKCNNLSIEVNNFDLRRGNK